MRARMGVVEPDARLIAEVRRRLAVHADPVRAEAQRAYMKSELPYLGVRLPDLRASVRHVVAVFPPPDRGTWEATVLALWDGATHREDRYAALVVARNRRAEAWRDPDLLPLLRHLVVTGAWWDVVDETAQHLVGDVLLRHRARVTPVMRDWAVDADVWLRRTSVICQLRHGPDTDLDLLRHAIEVNVSDESFWLRKAIGWALRQYARTDPDWVLAEVDRLGERLAGLSRREALKHLPTRS